MRPPIAKGGMLRRSLPGIPFDRLAKALAPAPRVVEAYPSEPMPKAETRPAATPFGRGLSNEEKARRPRKPWLVRR